MIRARVREWVERHKLLPRNANVVAACSGGPDSLALVDLLDSLRAELGFRLFVAHYDHLLRGEESRLDAEFVRQFCCSRELPFYCGRGNVREKVRQRAGSLEEVARRLRYEYLRQVARQVGGAWIATGHHRDDQAETLLLNLLRGSGGRGLGAMRPRQGDVIHPLLCLTRTEIENYCQEQGLHPRRDSSNSELDLRRNRVRHELVPLLRDRFNPALTDTLCRTADILADEQEFLRGFVLDNLSSWAIRTDEGYRLDAETFRRLPAAVQRELVRNLLEKLRGDLRGISFTHVEQILELFMRDRGDQYVDLPGNWQAYKSYRDLHIRAVAGSGERPGSNEVDGDASIVLNCPGETFLPDSGLVLRCTVHSGRWPLSESLDANKVAFDRENIQMPLILRHRVPGDLFRPLGAPGTRKLKKFLIDQKIPVDQRDRIWLVSDSAGILWVTGCRRSERGRLSAATREYVLMELAQFRNHNNH